MHTITEARSAAETLTMLRENYSPLGVLRLLVAAGLPPFHRDVVGEHEVQAALAEVGHDLTELEVVAVLQKFGGASLGEWETDAEGRLSNRVA